MDTLLGTILFFACLRGMASMTFPVLGFPRGWGAQFLIPEEELVARQRRPSDLHELLFSLPRREVESYL